MKTPEQVVIEFIDTYYRWNRVVYGVASDDREMVQAVALFGRSRLPGFNIRPDSFGYPPAHQPGCEMIRWVKRRHGRCRVGTRLTQQNGNSVFEMDYTYHLQCVGDQWVLERVVGPKPVRVTAEDEPAGANQTMQQAQDE